jgi:hypothetical protein
MKTCSRCLKEKGTEEFRRRSASKDGLSVWCRKCFADYDRDRWHAGDKERKQRNRKNAYLRNQQFLWRFLLEHPCADCGESDPEVLEFDHVDPALKKGNVTEFLFLSQRRIQVEIDKCEIRCCNCHRRRTNRQFGFWRSRMEVI